MQVRMQSWSMHDGLNGRLTDAELHALFDRLFPHGFAGADVLAEVAPDGWEQSPLLACFHQPAPTTVRAYREVYRRESGSSLRLNILRDRLGASRVRFAAPCSACRALDPPSALPLYCTCRSDQGLTPNSDGCELADPWSLIRL